VANQALSGNTSRLLRLMYLVDFALPPP